MASRRRTTEVREDNAKRKISTLSQSSSETAPSMAWENATYEDAHAHFLRWADHVRDRPAAHDRRRRNLLYASIYGNLPMLGFGVNTYTKNVPFQGQIALNATANAIDSLVAKLCKNRPRPAFSTIEGDYELREKIENADKHIDGLFMSQEYYQLTHPGRVLDMSIYGLGVTKAHEVDGEGIISREFPWEMIVDDRECMYGSPVRIGQRKFYDKQEVFDRWRKNGDAKSDKKWNDDLFEAIKGGETETDRGDFDRDESSEQILVYEGYRTKTAKSAGKKFIGIRGKTFRFEDYNEKESPYNFCLPGPRHMGLYGIGICERVAGIQREINRLIRDIQMAMHLIAKPHWMVEASSMVNAASLNNDIATIIKYSGSVPPQVYTPQAMSEQVFNHLQFLIKTLYEVTGISMLSATSQKPAGIDSAVGMRTYLNVETERFSDTLRNVEETASKDARKLAIVVSRTKSKKSVLAKSGYKRRSVELVKWDPIDIDTIAVQVQPTSKLPDTDAGKREYALELAQYTQVGVDDIFELLEWDDTEAFAKRRLAGKRNVERDIMRIRRGDKVVRDAIGDHKMAFKMMTDAYEEAKHDNLPQDRLSVMRNYIKACYKYITGSAFNDKGPNPLPSDGPMPGDPNAPPPGGPPMGMPQPMLPPGAPPPPMAPMANGGLPPPSPPGIPA